MKVIIYIILYFVLFVGYYLMFSLVGLFFGFAYQECIGNLNWFFTYLLFIHWWLIILSLHEYSTKHLKSL